MRSATTGSFFAAAFAGINPLISVSVTLITTMIIAEVNGKDAKVAIPVKCPKRALIPIESR